MNPIKAQISPGYRWRLVLMTLIMLGFGAYCVYDWQIGYPKKVTQYETYLEIKETHKDDYPTVWKERAAAEGWSSKIPGRKTDRDVFTQLLMALITVPLGVIFLIKLIRENMRWVAMDERGITANGGRVAPWDSFKALDETKWKTKGIAWLTYADADGRERKILLDDFKSEREPIKQIVTQVQGVLNPEPTGDDDQSASNGDGSIETTSATSESDTAATPHA